MRKLHALSVCLFIFILTICGVQAASMEEVEDSNRPDRKAKPVEFKDPSLFLKPASRVTLVVELEGQPAAQIYAESLRGGSGLKPAKEAAGAAVIKNRAEQNAIRATLTRFGGVELYSMQRVLNAIVVRMDASRIADLQRMPGVKRVSIAPRHTIENSTSVPFINSNVVWDTTGVFSTLGLTGDGVTIAIIDTGVDYLHANFTGDTTLYSLQNPDVIHSDGVPFPTGRVIAGFDFAGDNYDASGESGSDTPVPDPDPTDCNGHGSHVAGSAAGNGVQSGAAFTGPYDLLSADTLAFFDIGPGVAPEASIVALKVFGCTGSTDLTLQAIEFATDPNGDADLSDHYDVINMSLGSNYGFAGAQFDAIENAVAAGVIVVTSAGNAGDVHYITSSPGSATSAISTAASIDSGVLNTKLDVDQNGDDTVDASFFAVQQTAYAPELSGEAPPILTKLQFPTGDILGCAPADFAGFTPGNVALIRRGTCSGKMKVFNAEAAGASAVVIISTDNPVSLADDPLVGPVGIPAVMISVSAGNSISVNIATAKGQIDSNGISAADILASFSSRGPRRRNLTGETILKPDISAPGFNITSTRTCYTGACSGNESFVNNGTSMASPHVAGAMALLRELHPTWTVPELKALIMNTAGHDTFTQDLTTGTTGVRMGSPRQGAGRVDVLTAATNAVFANGTANPNAVSLAFIVDILNEPGTVSDVKTVTITNRYPFPVSYSTSIDTSLNTTGVDFSVLPDSVTIPPFSSANVEVTVTYTPTAMTHITDPTSSTSQGTPTLSRHWISEEAGNLLLTPTAGATHTLRVPLYAEARPASAMDAPDNVNVGAAVGVVSIPLTGVQVSQGSGRALYTGRVVGFQLLHSSPEVNPGPDLWDGGDLQYVGATSDAVFGGTTSFIGMSMYGSWDTPRMREVYICVDLDQDGSGGVFNDGTDFCYLARAQAGTDNFMVYLWDINNFLNQGAGSLTLWDYQNFLSPTSRETRIFNNDVMAIAVDSGPAAWPGEPMTSGSGDSVEAFNFYVYTQDFNHPAAPGGTITDSTPTLTFDPANPVFNHAEGTNEGFRIDPMITDLDLTSFDFIYNLSSDPDTQAEILLLHFYNLDGNRADVVTVTSRLLTVQGDGTGDGTITDTVPGGTINCISTAGVESGDCSQATSNGAVFALTATPNSNSVFVVWTGCDLTSGINNEICDVTMTASKTVTATFTAKPVLNVAGSGPGTGTMIDLTPGGTVNCISIGGNTSGDCSEQTNSSTVFAIVAAPDGNSDFGGWTGCDSTSGTNNEVCNVTLNSDITVTANFTVEPILTVSGAGLGTGTMSDSGLTITCISTAGSSIGDCSEQADFGTAFAITAAPDGNSDFGGWAGCDSTSGANNEICNIILTADRTVTATFDVEPILTVAGAGLGTGTITDVGGTINCTSTAGTGSGDCSEQPDNGTVFAITAAPDGNSDFGGWTGCDSTSGTNNEICNVTLTADRTVTASFDVEPILTAAGAGLGTGTMTDVGGTINCTSTAGTGSGDCSEQPDNGTVFAITAAPDGNSDFGGWTGCDSTSGTNNEICNVTLTADRTVTAVFNAEPILTVAGSGSGNGTMADSIPGTTISCTSTGGTSTGDCSEQQDLGTVFAIVASPAVGSIFGGWLGCDSTSTTNLPGDTCNIVMDSNAIVTAAFDACPTITLSPSTLPDGNGNLPYNQTLTASGGVGPYTFTITSGTLPDGLTLLPDGTLSGTPTATGTFVFDITATDSNQCTGSQSYTVNINAFILLIDDFEDGTMDWTQVKGNCQEVNGSLVCNGVNKSVRIFAPTPWSPSGLSQCSVCTIDMDVNVTATPLGRVILHGWYQDKKNLVELVIKEDRNKVVLKQKSGGTVVAKQAVPFTITPGVNHLIEMNFDGTNFTVSVDGQLIITMPAKATPNGTVGYRVVGTSASFAEITIL